MIKVKVLKDDGTDIILRREKTSGLLPKGMIIRIPEPYIDFNVIKAFVEVEKEE